MMFFLVLLSISTQLLAAVILQYTALTFEQVTLLAVSYVLLVLLLHFFRFIIWGWIYNKHDLSYAYPFTSLFFPLIYIIALIQGTATLKAMKVLAIMIILTGIVLVHRSEYKGKRRHVK